MMTKALERAIRKASALPAADQNAFARWMLQELADEARWQRSFRRSQDKLRHMAAAALADHKRGRTRRIDSDRS